MNNKKSIVVKDIEGFNDFSVGNICLEGISNEFEKHINNKINNKDIIKELDEDSILKIKLYSQINKLCHFLYAGDFEFVSKIVKDISPNQLSSIFLWRAIVELSIKNSNISNFGGYLSVLKSLEQVKSHMLGSGFIKDYNINELLSSFKKTTFFNSTKNWPEALDNIFSLSEESFKELDMTDKEKRIAKSEMYIFDSTYALSLADKMEFFINNELDCFSSKEVYRKIKEFELDAAVLINPNDVNTKINEAYKWTGK